MRILFLNYEYPPLGGGAGNATSYILREYSKIDGIEVDLVTSSVGKEYEVEKIGDNIRIHKLPIGKDKNNLHFQSQWDLLVYTWKAFFFSNKLIRKSSYDLSHSFFTVPCGFLSLFFKKNYSLPYIVSLRGADVPGYSERFTFLYKIINPLVRSIWRNSAAVVSNSQGLKDLALKTRTSQRIEIIYNGIDTNEFRPSESGNSDDVFRVICVSRITERKGIKYLIEAVGELKNKYPQVKLKIVGEGDEKEKLEKLVREMKLENNIEFTGLINHKDLPNHYQQSQVFVLPSLNEGMSNTMLEALASGLPIVATDTGGTKELVEDGENGFIVKMEDSKDIAEKVEKLINNEDLRQKMASKSRKKAENMSWKKVAQDYFDLYKKISQ